MIFNMDRSHSARRTRDQIWLESKTTYERDPNLIWFVYVAIVAQIAHSDLVAVIVI